MFNIETGGNLDKRVHPDLAAMFSGYRQRLWATQVYDECLI